VVAPPSVRAVGDEVNQPLTIVHVVDPGFAGGTESVIRGLAIGHHRRGHNVHVIGVVQSNADEHPYLRSLSAQGVKTHGLEVSARAYLRERRLMRRTLRALKPDVVHTHGYRSDVIDSGVARGLGIPTVTTLHGSSKLGGRTILHEWLQYRVMGRFQAVVAVSRTIVAELEDLGIPSDHVHWIPNAWVSSVEPLSRADARRELGLRPTDFVVGWVARMIPVKACDNFLRAFAGCRGMPVQAAIIGDGPERAQAEALCAELGIEGAVRFCGAREQASRFFPAFDAFVLSSRTEGTPITLLEALAAGVPVVSTNVGGIPDVVSSPEQALLVPPNDSTALGAAIRSTVSEPNIARARARAATIRLREDFSGDRWLERHEALYRSIRRAPSGT
jgi:glycosyltransferase involved in cell wall biosynthesis